MQNLEVNLLAVLVAALVYMAIGAFWYSPLVFGKVWARLADLKDGRMSKESYLIGFVAALIMAYVLANFVDYLRATTLVEGAIVGFWCWLGFVATTALGGVIWEKKPVKLYVLNNGIALIGMLIMGAILAVWI